MTAIASSINATTMDRTAAFFIVSLISSVMYHADRSEEKHYSQVEGNVERQSGPSLWEAPAYGRRHHTTSSERSELTRKADWRSPHYPSDRARRNDEVKTTGG